jgi:ethanolamine transporter EutH
MSEEREKKLIIECRLVGLFALPVGILANGFLTEYNKIRYNSIVD